MSQVKNSNSPKGGLTAQRSNRWLAIGLTVLCTVFLTGCKDKEQPVNPYVDPGTTENPNWVLTVDNDMTSSMTAIVRVSFTDQPGTIAAFIGNDCCGVAEYQADYGLYWLYISPASEQGGDVLLRFYSPNLKRIFDATSTFPFRNDTHLGSVSAPYTPEWEVAK